jgi:NTE family protein
VSARVGLVLGAGGVAGGAFHAGVLAALAERTGWDPRSAAVIVGTSAGSITGASLRGGLPAPDLLASALDRPLSPEGQQLLDRVGSRRSAPLGPAERRLRTPGAMAGTLARAARQPFAARPWSLAAALLPEGTVSTDVISAGFGEVFGDDWPPGALRLCALRQSDGRRVVFGGERRPPLPDAVAASCAIPGWFAPVVIDGEAHLDGGAHSPTNADVLLDHLPLDLVLVSSPMSRRSRRPRLAADQAMRRWASAVLDAEVRRLRRRGTTVVTFQPDDEVLDAAGINAMDPSRRGRIATAAHRSTTTRSARRDVADRLAALA